MHRETHWDVPPPLPRRDQQGAHLQKRYKGASEQSATAKPAGKHRLQPLTNQATKQPSSLASATERNSPNGLRSNQSKFHHPGRIEPLKSFEHNQEHTHRERQSVKSTYLRPTALLAITTAITIATTAAIATSQDQQSKQNTPIATNTPSKQPTTIPLHVFSSTGELVGPLNLPKLELSEADWKLRLTPEQFKILRNDGTEPAFCGNLLDNKLEGVYCCAGCGLPLFTSDSKFKSGTGWPSFFQPVSMDNIAMHIDRSYGMVRTEITCARCGGHLGHVFSDGPEPTGLRYCVNSESLVFYEWDEIEQITEVHEAVFAGGCFWCVEAVFEQINGVIDVESGYAGGDGPAKYAAVVTGTTGHAESIRITYDPNIISYEKLLEVHFSTHDPTQLNRQGNDVGTHYRSAIFYSSEEQRQITQNFIDKLQDSGKFDRPIVTTLEALETYTRAEDYHQDYAARNPNQGYIRAISKPKVDKARKYFKDYLKPTPDGTKED